MQRGARRYRTDRRNRTRKSAKTGGLEGCKRGSEPSHSEGCTKSRTKLIDGEGGSDVKKPRLRKLQVLIEEGRLLAVCYALESNKTISVEQLNMVKVELAERDELKWRDDSR